MASQYPPSRAPALKRLNRDAEHSFRDPVKKINDGDDLNFFLSSSAYRDLTTWLFELNRAVFPTKNEGGAVSICTLDSPPPYSKSVDKLRRLLTALSDLINDAPPNTGPRRFGNVAFRTWYRLAEDNADDLLDYHFESVLSNLDGDGASSLSALRDEVKSYLLGSLGSAQRLDYGTGHELSFLAFLGCLWKLGAFADGEERAVVVGVIQPYLELVRKLIVTYTLEPAGSHGVWGLDDHSFMPYIFGSAQLGPPITSANQITPTENSLETAPEVSSVTSKPTVAQYSKQNMYFSAIQFIYDVKKGPFWEHSPILYDISGIKDGWGKINKGMLKMYVAEVLGKIPVVQHFPFGSFFRWERDPDSVAQHATVHAQQQPAAVSKDVPVPARRDNAGTAAPWTKNAGMAMRQMPASTGMPSTRAPWAMRPASEHSTETVAGSTSQRRPAPGGSNGPSTEHTYVP